MTLWFVWFNDYDVYPSTGGTRSQFPFNNYYYNTYIFNFNDARELLPSWAIRRKLPRKQVTEIPSQPQSSAAVAASARETTWLPHLSHQSESIWEHVLFILVASERIAFIFRKMGKKRKNRDDNDETEFDPAPKHLQTAHIKNQEKRLIIILENAQLESVKVRLYFFVYGVDNSECNALYESELFTSSCI